jgi:CHAD domain-containing protein
MAKAKPIAGIDCDGPAATGMALVLSQRFAEMCGFRDAALDWSSSEGVHDMRVASRRLRGALKDFRPYFESENLNECSKQIKEIADALGRVRDGDVAIETLESIVTNVPASVVDGIRQLAQQRHIDRDAQRVKLLLALDSGLLDQLKIKFTGAVSAPESSGRGTKSGKVNALSYRKAATEIILGRLENLEKLSDSLKHPHKIKPLHDMRIAAKYLRYALELFGPCWEGELLVTAKEVSSIQSSLGKLHDCDVWIEDIRSAATDEDGGQEAADWLLDHFADLRSKHFNKAVVQWREWDAADRSAKLRRTVN